MSGAAPPAPSAAWAWFLDVDGTLLEIAPRPDAVKVEPALVALLGRLHAAAGGALALVSGRGVAELDALFVPVRLPAAGQHGLERRDAAGALHRHAFDAAALARAVRSLERFAAQHPALLLEDKGCSVALHFRAAPQLETAARTALEEARALAGAEFAVQPGKMVLELKPAGRDKGRALEEFMHEAPFAGRLPVYVGDDLTDEHGFAAVNRRGGHSVRVGAGPSAARWRLETPCAVRDWLGSAAA